MDKIKEQEKVKAIEAYGDCFQNQTSSLTSLLAKSEKLAGYRFILAYY